MVLVKYRVNPTELNQIYKNEIGIYVEHFKLLPKKDIEKLSKSISDKAEKEMITFHENLLLEAFKKLLITP
jgi:ABC-type transporter MlaC component